MYRVLVVDDVPAAVMVLARALRGGGYHVVEAEGAAAALRILESCHVDALVTNIRLAGLSGPELARSAWEIDPALAVVLLSACAPATAVPCDLLSRALVVTKPSAKALRTALGRALDHARHRYPEPPSQPAYNPVKPFKLGLHSGLSLLLGL